MINEFEQTCPDCGGLRFRVKFVRFQDVNGKHWGSMHFQCVRCFPRIKTAFIVECGQIPHDSFYGQKFGVPA